MQLRLNAPNRKKILGHTLEPIKMQIMMTIARHSASAPAAPDFQLTIL
jgi:hypothetical protein